jgi:hypothetical protein
VRNRGFLPDQFKDIIEVSHYRISDIGDHVSLIAYGIMEDHVFEMVSEDTVDFLNPPGEIEIVGYVNYLVHTGELTLTAHE